MDTSKKWCWWTWKSKPLLHEALFAALPSAPYASLSASSRQILERVLSVIYSAREYALHVFRWGTGHRAGNWVQSVLDLVFFVGWSLYACLCVDGRVCSCHTTIGRYDAAPMTEILDCCHTAAHIDVVNRGQSRGLFYHPRACKSSWAARRTL